MKKLVIATIALMMLTTSVAAPRRAEAALGIASFAAGGIPWIVVGGVLSGGAALVGGWGIWAIGYGANDSGMWGRLEAAIGVVALITGLVLLDGRGGLDVAFTQLTPLNARSMDMSDVELNGFNAELPQLNAVRETVQGEVLSEVQGGQRLADVDVHGKWEAYRGMLAPESYSALEKVSARMIEVMKKGASK